MPTTIFNSLRAITILQIAISLMGSLSFWALGQPQLGASFAVGGALMLANVLAIAWTSWRLVEKKPIAWTVIIIVIKYAVLLGSVVFFARTNWFDSLGAGLGVASFLIAILGAALLTTKSAEARIEKIRLKKKLRKAQTKNAD